MQSIIKMFHSLKHLITISDGVAVLLTIITYFSTPILTAIFGDGSVEVVALKTSKLDFFNFYQGEDQDDWWAKCKTDEERVRDAFGFDYGILNHILAGWWRDNWFSELQGNHPNYRQTANHLDTCNIFSSSSPGNQPWRA